MGTFLIRLLFVLGIAGCAIERTATLYPAAGARPGAEALQARFIASGSGHGRLELVMPDGEQIRGEYTIVRGGAVSFGQAFTVANGPGGPVSANGSATSITVAGSSQGVADAVGDRGTTIRCEFLNDNRSGHGYGGCLTSAGAGYRIQY